MKLFINERSFGLIGKEIMEEGDIISRSIILEGSEAIILLKDLSWGGMEIVVENEWVQAVLDLLEVKTSLILNGQQEEGKRKKNFKEIKRIVREFSWVIVPRETDLDLDRCLPEKCLAFFKEPQNPNFFKGIIRLRWEGNRLGIFMGGEEKEIGSILASSRRFYSQLGKCLEEACGEGRQTKEVFIPPVAITKGRALTTLEAEIKFFQTLLEQRLGNFTLPKGKTEEMIAQILIRHCEEGVKVDKERVKEIIKKSVGKEKPIPIFLSLAICCRVENRLKFFEKTQLPHLGWMHLMYFFKVIGEKVKTIYSPGITVKIFDEAQLFSGSLGIDPGKITRNREVIKKFAELLQAPVEILPMEENCFPEEALEEISAEPNVSQIYAMVCSLPGMEVKEAMDPLYRRKTKDYLKIQSMVGPAIWLEAEEKSSRVVKLLAYRKKINLFRVLTGESDYLDACITDKTGRLCFDVTSPSLINHGMPIIQRTGQGQYKILIVPEYRVREEYPQAKAILLEKRELIPDQTEAGFITFFYLIN